MLKYNNIIKSTKTKLGNDILLIEKVNSPLTTHNSLIIGVFHGDEPQGKFLIEEYINPSSESYAASALNGYASLSPSADLQIPVLPQGEDIYSHQYAKHLRPLSQKLRNNSTKEEIILWQHIKQKQLGVKFRRQQPIGKFIADFVCFEKKIIIEIDGGQHNEDINLSKDQIRDEFFKQNGYKVLRFWNSEINNNIEGVIEFIKKELKCPPLEGGPESLIPRRGMRGGKNLLFIPCLNPDGMQLGMRTNANGVDLNRNFPTKNWGEDTSQAGDNPADYFSGQSAGSEIETQFVIDVIEQYKPELIITLHAPYKIVNYDGPAKEIAEKISEIIKYPVEASIGYPTPGSFGTYAGIERQIPTITLELDETCPVENLINPVHEIFDLFTV